MVNEDTNVVAFLRLSRLAIHPIDSDDVCFLHSPGSLQTPRRTSWRGKLRHRHALAYARQDDIGHAITLLRMGWVSLPGGIQSRLTMGKTRALSPRCVDDAVMP
jgi:hypothetical protein